MPGPAPTARPSLLAPARRGSLTPGLASRHLCAPLCPCWPCCAAAAGRWGAPARATTLAREATASLLASGQQRPRWPAGKRGHAGRGLWPRGRPGAAPSCGQVIAGGIAARPWNPGVCQPRAVGRRCEVGQAWVSCRQRWAVCACLPTLPAAPPAGPSARGESSMVPGGPAWGQGAFHTHPSHPCSLARGDEAGGDPASASSRPAPAAHPGQRPWAHTPTLGS